MAMRFNPYIHLAGRAREALEFYQSVLGGQLQISTYGEGGMSQNPAEAQKVMHGQLEAPNGFVLMVSDAPEGMPVSNTSNISLSLSGDDEAQLRRYWEGLLDGARVVEPLEKAPWGDTFGMLTDKFGIGWMVNIAGQQG